MPATTNSHPCARRELPGTPGVPRAALALLLAMGGAALAGCRGEVSEKPPRQFLPDMDDQPKLKAQSVSPFFQEYSSSDLGRYGRSMREPVPGTVPFGARSSPASFTVGETTVDPADRADYLRDSDRFYLGLETAEVDDRGNPVIDAATGLPRARYVAAMPVPVTAELIDLGREKYGIYCLPCHGGDGVGNGLVGREWSYDLPSFHEETYQHGGAKGDDGFIFWTIRHGVPNVGGTYPLKMPSYASKVDEYESWAIVSYIRTLQRHRSGTLQDLPEIERQRLERERPAAVGAVTGSSNAAVSEATR